MIYPVYGNSLLKKSELQFREANSGAISLQDIFDYVDIAIADALNPQNVRINAEINKASLAATEKAIAELFDKLK